MMETKIMIKKMKIFILQEWILVFVIVVGVIL